MPRLSMLALEKHDQLLQAIERHRRALPSDDDAQDAEVARRAADLRRLARRRQDGDLAVWEAMADRIIAKRALPIERDSDEYRELVDGLAEASIEALSLFKRRHDGEIDPQPRSELIRVERQREQATAPAGEGLLDLFDKYASQRLMEGKRADSVAQDRILVEQFAAFVGKGRRLDSITRADVRDFRDTMAALPVNYRNANAYKGLDMRAAAAKAAKLEAKTLAPKTINKNLSALSPFFAWAVSNGHADANPCDGLFYAIDKDAGSRDPFTVEQLNAILRSPLFAGFLANGAEHKPGNQRADDWRKWIPLACMFSGARIGEIAQLRIADVESIHGRWFIHIRDDEKTGQRTKSGKSRMVPVHRALEAMGFVRFCEEQRKRAGGDGSGQLFPELEANDRDHIGAMPSKWWRRYLGKIGVKDGGDGLGAHAFRHTLADELRAAGFLDAQFGPLILGHHKASVTGKYGRIAQGTVDTLCAMIDGVAFKGVDFGRLIPAS